MKAKATPFAVLVLWTSAISLIVLLTSFTTRLSSDYRASSTLAEVVVVNLTAPSTIVACGDEQNLLVEISNTDPVDALDKVEASFVLPPGVSITGLSAGTVPTASGFTLVDPLAPLDMIVVTVTLAGDCGLAAGSTTIPVTVSHDPVAAAMNNMVTETSTGIDLVLPQLDITAATPSTVNYSYIGFEFAIDATVANTSAGDIAEFTYCVEDNALATITSVMVAGNALATTAGPAGQSCFLVTATDIDNALGGAPFSNTNFTVVENWEITMCGSGGTLARRAEYGCNGQSNCNGTGFADFPQTTISPMIPDPILSLSITPMAGGTMSLCGTGQTYSFTVTYNGPKPTLEDVVATINLPAGISTEDKKLHWIKGTTIRTECYKQFAEDPTLAIQWFDDHM